MFVSANRWILTSICYVLALVSLKANANYDPYLNITDTLRASEPLRYPVSLSMAETLLTLCELQRGREYRVYLNALQAKAGQHPLLALRHRSDYTVWYDDRVLSFVARSTCEVLQIVQPGRSAELEAVVSVGCHDCAAVKPLGARNGDDLEVSNTTYTPEELVQEVFIGGDCFDVNSSSIVYTGDPQGRGSFSNGSSSINIEEGVLLTSGRVTNALGPNNAYNTGNSFWSAPYADPDLRGIINNNSTLIHDVAALEFDFTPTSDEVSFEFVFASEEYCEYAGSQYNDVFGFFISGPGINGPFSNNAENIAVVPGSSDYVTINNVNHYSNSAYYVNNIPSWQHIFMPSWLSCPGYDTNDGVAIQNIEYDGFTTLLTAIAQVEACETYHIKLIVADVNDAYYDSAVFLKANSFNAGGTALVDAEVPGLDGDVAYEGCKDGVFVFKRANDDLTEDLEVNFTIGSSSTALQGVDFENLPTSITIPIGDSIAYLPVNVFSDLFIEGSESIVLELDAPCSCNVPSTVLYITDLDSIQVALDDEYLCDAAPLNLQPSISGGLPGFDYLWNTDDTTADLSVMPNGDTSYVLTVTDACGNTAMATATVDIVGLPTANISGLAQVCSGNPQAELLVEFTGEGPWSFAYTIDNNQIFQLDSITQNPYLLNTPTVGTYLLTGVSSHGCVGSVAGAASVLPIDLATNLLSAEVSCPGANDGQIDLSVSGGQPPYDYLWSNGAVQEDPTGLPEGSYSVTITDSNGCSVATTANVALNPEVPQVEAGEAVQLTCESPFLSLAGSGSTGPQYDYRWTSRDGNIVSGDMTATPMIDRPGLYILAITNTATGCSQSDEVAVSIDTLKPQPVLVTQGPLVLDCRNPQTVIDGSSSQGQGPLDFLWTTNDGSILPGEATQPQLSISLSGTYTLQITDNQNGCSDTSNVAILSDMDLPLVNIFPPEAITCVDTSVQIDASGSSSGVPFLYSWSTSNGQIVAGADGLLPMVSQGGQYTLIIVNDDTGCEAVASVTVPTDLMPPMVEAGVADSLDCDSPEITLAGSASSSNNNHSLLWTTTTGNIDTGALTLQPVVNLGGVYTLTVTNGDNGCTAADEVEVFENTNVPYDLDILSEAPPCFGDLGTMTVLEVLGGVGPYLYSLDDGQLFFSDASTFTILEPGTYNLLVQDLNGCEYEETFVIPPTPPIVVDVQPLIKICLGHPAEIRTNTNVPDTRIDTIIWTPADSLSCYNCLDPVARPVESTLYTITLIDVNGCEAMDEVLVEVDKTRKIYIPNAFSPDDDGYNDNFTIYADALSVVKISQFQVFDRWGGKVFERRNLQPNIDEIGWDGSSRGKKLNPGVFVYFAEIEFVDGVKKIYKGDVSLLD